MLELYDYARAIALPICALGLMGFFGLLFAAWTQRMKTDDEDEEETLPRVKP
jgi:hypothetical protein